MVLITKTWGTSMHRGEYMTIKAVNDLFGIFFRRKSHEDHIPGQQSRISRETHMQTS
jgi:hypothetical protein